jgi:hypothetical protein
LQQQREEDDEKDENEEKLMLVVIYRVRIEYFCTPVLLIAPKEVSWG